jgi:hypothetical protein
MRAAIDDFVLFFSADIVSGGSWVSHLGIEEEGEPVTKSE